VVTKAKYGTKRRPKLCPCCGQVIAPELQLPLVKQRIYNAVRWSGSITRSDLMNRVYRDHRDGGPVYENVIAVHIKQMNERWLRPRGIEIKGTGGPGSTYSIRKYAA
jgi:hypothetical protein